MTSIAFKHKIIARRARNLWYAHNEIKCARVHDSAGRCVVRMYFEPSTQLNAKQLKRWRKWLLAENYLVVSEKGLKKVSFYCRLDNFWWKWLKCSFC